jgi:rod shape-determining protein MreC
MRNFLDSKSSRAQQSTPINPFALAVGLIVLACALLLMDRAGWLVPLRGRIEQVIGPTGGALGSVRQEAATIVQFGGAAENEALRQQVSTLQATVVALQQVVVQNNTLRQQLAIRDQNPWAQHMLPAEVTFRSPDSGRRTVGISIGSEDGVRVGMAVVGQQGSSPPGLVGIVEEVSPHTAGVLLITDFGSQISARVIHGTGSATGVVQGQWQRGSRLRLGQLTRDVTLGIGDPVVTAGLTRQLGIDLPLQAIPAGIPVGSIETSGADGHTVTAALRPYVDPDQVNDVWVVLGAGS